MNPRVTDSGIDEKAFSITLRGTSEKYVAKMQLKSCSGGALAADADDDGGGSGGDDDDDDGGGGGGGGDDDDDDGHRGDVVASIEATVESLRLEALAQQEAERADDLTCDDNDDGGGGAVPGSW